MTIHENYGQAVFGPVPSRRLGLSLGVDLVRPKTCTLDCVYCELGITTCLTTTRARFRDPDEVLTQVKKRLGELSSPPDFLTLSGSGEPTLHLDLEKILRDLRQMSKSRLAVLTNGTLTPDPRVRSALSLADVVVPSLDAVTPEVFQKVNRPAPGLNPQDIIEGLRALGRDHKGEMLLEILLVAGINDTDQEIARLVKAAAEINPTRVQLNTVVRPPAVSGMKAVDDERLKEIAARFSVPTEVIAPPKGRAGPDKGRLDQQVVEMTRRRPCTLADVAAMAGIGQKEAQRLIQRLIRGGCMTEEHFGAKTFYRGI